jgi:hypothetical protein
MKKDLLAFVCASSLALAGVAHAGSVAVEDFNTTIFLPTSTPVTDTISASWGTYSGGVFTPLFGATQSTINSGYFDAPENELFVGLTQSDNTLLAAGTAMFVSIFNVPGGSGTSTWFSSAEQIVLSDPTWIAPTFTLATPELTWTLGSSTVAMSLAQFGGSTGTYSFNDGAPQVTLVPEPSTYALLGLASLALGGYAMRRRNRA